MFCNNKSRWLTAWWLVYKFRFQGFSRTHFSSVGRGWIVATSGSGGLSIGSTGSVWHGPIRPGAPFSVHSCIQRKQHALDINKLTFQRYVIKLLKYQVCWSARTVNTQDSDHVLTMFFELKWQPENILSGSVPHVPYGGHSQGLVSN